MGERRMNAISSSQSNYRYADVIFYVAFGIWLTMTILRRTAYIGLLNSLISIDTIRHFCLTLLVVYDIFLADHKSRVLLATIVTCILAYICIRSNNIEFFDTVCIIYVAREIPFRKLAQFFCIILFSVVLINIISALVGLVPNIPYGSALRGARYSLGFGHPNTGPAFSVYVFAYWAYFREDRFGLVDAAIIALLGFSLFSLTGSRSGFYFTLLIAVLMLFMHWVSEDWLRKWVFKMPLVGSVAIIATTMLLLCALYDPNVSWMSRLNEILSGRLSLGHEGLQLFGVPFLGQPVNFGTSGRYSISTWQWVNGNGMPVIDSMYIRILVNEGVIFSLVVLGVTTWSLNRLYRLGQYRILVLVFVMALYGITEGNASLLAYNVSLFLLMLPAYPLEDNACRLGVDILRGSSGSV